MPWSCLGDIDIIHAVTKSVEKKFSLWWSNEVMTVDAVAVSTTLDRDIHFLKIFLKSVGKASGGVGQRSQVRVRNRPFFL